MHQQIADVSDSLCWKELIDRAQQFFDHEGNLKEGPSLINAVKHMNYVDASSGTPRVGLASGNVKNPSLVIFEPSLGYEPLDGICTLMEETR